ncbi:MAG: DNA polymerase III subunit delta [Bacteroidetes bacterium]|nr:DNA polymerase III subunit delta [Bacteroidota bacterium]HET6245541.1 DNA polymerase III subunit delta [Bacteroidia bacterium]
MLFKDIIGQQELKNRLIQSVKSNRISHGQLFIGPEGCGKLALAIAYMQYVNCLVRTDEDSCGICSSCIKYNKLIHPDLHFIFPVNTSKENTGAVISDTYLGKWRASIYNDPYLSLNEWYETMGIENKQGVINVNDSTEVIKKLSLKSYEADYKVMIIWMVEKMNTAASNKLLKILEEPPDKTVFILISEQFEQLLPTITSRTQLIKVKKIKDSDLIAWLLKNPDVSKEKASQVAFLADGNRITAKKLMQENAEDDIFTSLFIQWMRISFGVNIPEAIEWTSTIATAGREKQKNFIHYSLQMIRECMLMNYAAGKNLNKANGSEAAFLQKFSPFIHGGNCLQITEELTKAAQHIERNANGRILFLDLSLRMMKLLKLKA